MKKNKFRLKKVPIIILFSLLLLPFLINFYISTTPYGKLRDLNYSKEAIKLMDEEIKESLIEKGIYIKTVEKSLLEELFVPQYLNYYYEIEYVEDSKFIFEVNSLIEKGYNVEEIEKIILNLDEQETKFIIDYDYIENIIRYINISYIDVYKMERYLNYLNKNNEVSLEKVITNVNIGLDYDFYDEEIMEMVIPEGYDFVVNKYRYLDENYEPTDLVKISEQCSIEESFLRKEAANAFERMCQDSLKEGYSVLSRSAYRSFSSQQEVWDYYMHNNGEAYTYYYVAKPGHSEHQTGLALDLASGSDSNSKFAFTKDYTWTLNNAHKYGFIIRCEEDKEHITGYNFEPWHIRYVGLDVANYIYENDITLDEYDAQH